MVMRVQHVDGEYRVVLSAEAMEALRLTDGAAVEVKPAPSTVAVFEYLSNAEALEAFRSTEEQHREAYRELAK